MHLLQSPSCDILFVARGSAQLLAVYIYLYCLRKMETGGHFASTVILSFSLSFSLGRSNGAY